MKKFLIFLVLLFSTTLIISQSTAQNTNNATSTCRTLINSLEPCTRTVSRHEGFFFNRIRFITPINASCCETIVAIGDTCPRMIRRPWFSRAHRSCTKPLVDPPAPQPTPPVKTTCDYRRLRPCVVEMADFYFGRRNSTISGECCSTLLDLEADCGPHHGEFFNRSLDYCHNHQ